MRKFQVKVNGNLYEVEVEEVTGGVPTTQVQAVESVKVVQPEPVKVAPQVSVAPSAPVEGTKVQAPMPGKIVDVKVKVGQEVNEGDLVAILEAMKMENEVFASCTGRIASIDVTVGAMVESNDAIVTIN